MKKLTFLILKLIFGVSSFAQMDDFYSEGVSDVYFTRNSAGYVYTNDSAKLVLTGPSETKNYWAIGFRLQRHGEHFHWTYRNEFEELVIGFALNVVSKGKINKDLDNIRKDNLVGGFYFGEFNGAWNVVNRNNTKMALGFNVGDLSIDGPGVRIENTHLLGIGLHSIFEQKLTDKFALRGIYTIGITGRVEPDPLKEQDWLPHYRRTTIELLTDFGMYLALEHLKFSAPSMFFYQRRIDVKIGLRV